MRVTVTRSYSFEASHELPEEFGGPATRLHGHSYTVRVQVEGGLPTEALDRHWEGCLRPRVDHRLLNETFADTTVEGLAVEFFRILAAAAPVVAVEVQEGALRFARAEA